MSLRHFRLHMSNTEFPIFPSKSAPFCIIMVIGNCSCLDPNPWDHAGLFSFIFYIQCLRKSCQLSHQNMFRIQTCRRAQCCCLVHVIISAQLPETAFQSLSLLLPCPLSAFAAQQPCLKLYNVSPFLLE